MPRLQIFKSERETCHALAEWLKQLLAPTHSPDTKNILVSFKHFPSAMLQLLQKMEWPNTRWFIINDHPSGFWNAFADQKKIPASHIVLLESYSDLALPENVIRKSIDGSRHSFELALSGLGEDSSAFGWVPGDEGAIHFGDLLGLRTHPDGSVKIVPSPSLVNASAHQVLLATGGRHTEQVQHILKGRYDPNHLPAQWVQPVYHAVHWYLDHAAASGLIHDNKYQ